MDKNYEFARPTTGLVVSAYLKVPSVQVHSTIGMLNGAAVAMLVTNLLN